MSVQYPRLPNSNPERESRSTKKAMQENKGTTKKDASSSDPTLPDNTQTGDPTAVNPSLPDDIKIEDPDVASSTLQDGTRIEASVKTDEQPTESDVDMEKEEPSKTEKASVYTKEQREAITRVRKCRSKDYYGILGLQESCTPTEIKKAYRSFSFLTHPDKNKYKDAEMAFKKILTAYEVLKEPSERRKYNQELKGLKRRGKLDPPKNWDEDFALNASGADSNSDSSETDLDNSEDEEKSSKLKQIPMPSKIVLDLYDEATPWVEKLLSNPNDPKSRNKIDRINTKIKKQDQLEGLHQDEHNININVLRAIGMEVNSATQAIEKNPENSKAKKSLRDQEDQLERTIRVHMYPQDWLNFLGGNTRNPNNKPQKISSLTPGSDESDTSEGGIESEDVEMGYDSEPSSRLKAGRSQNKRKWNPGQTRKGEDILAYKPFERTNRLTNEKCAIGHQFIIERKGQPNPVALVSGEEVGRQATDAYINLPEERKVDIRYTERNYTYKDAKEFDSIIGFACKPFKTKTEGSGANYPPGYAYYLMKDGTKRFVSRAAMRKIFGRKDADNDIEDFYEEINEARPWQIEPELTKPKRLTNGSKSKRRPKARKSIHSDYETEDESDSSNIFLSSKKHDQHGRESDSSDEASSGDDSLKSRKTTKRGATFKKKQLSQSENQVELITNILEQLMKKNADEQKRQMESMVQNYLQQNSEAVKA